jgi:hypothetical protein
MSKKTGRATGTEHQTMSWAAGRSRVRAELEALITEEQNTKKPGRLEDVATRCPYIYIVAGKGGEAGDHA